jgi:hypothetical protein
MQSRFKKTLYLTVLAISLLFANGYPVFALLCPKDSSEIPVPQMLAISASVFSGRVVDRQISYVKGKPTLNPKYTLKVTRVWKGRLSKYLTVIGTGLDPFTFDERYEYLIYAYAGENDGEVRVGFCKGRALPIQFTKDELAILGKGEEPPQIESYEILGLVLLGVLGILAAGIFYFQIMRFRRN